MLSYNNKDQHRSLPTCSKCSQVKCIPAFGPMSFPQNELSIVKIFGNFSSLKVATLAVASLDFYTPNLESWKLKYGQSFPRINGKIQVSSGALG